MLLWQILIDGFAISALYALGATGFTLIFGVSVDRKPRCEQATERPPNSRSEALQAFLNSS